MFEKPIDYGDALQSLVPNASWRIEGGQLDGLIWLDESVAQPSNEEIEAEVLRLENAKTAAAEATEAARVSAYGKLHGLGLTDAEITALLGGI